MLLWDALILLIAATDGLRLPNPATITATRSWLSAPSLGTSVEIELSLSHENKIALDCFLTDDLPAELLENSIDMLNPEPTTHIPATLRYAVRAPGERGDIAPRLARSISAIALRLGWSTTGPSRLSNSPSASILNSAPLKTSSSSLLKAAASSSSSARCASAVSAASSNPFANTVPATTSAISAGQPQPAAATSSPASIRPNAANPSGSSWTPAA